MISTVLEIMEPLLNLNQILCANNFYTSVTSAHLLIEKRPILLEHYVTEDSSTQRELPTTTKLKRGEMYSLQSKYMLVSDGIKKDVLFLTAKQRPELLDVNIKSGTEK